MNGTNGKIIPLEGGWVQKKLKRYSQGRSIEEQRYIHQVIDSILQNGPNYKILRTPLLHEARGYIMEEVFTNKPLWLSDEDSKALYDTNLVHDTESELRCLFTTLWRDHRMAAWDFELYVQPDGSVVILDFDKFKINIEEGFFDHACFPRNFSLAHN
jgi:hypothetical protein